MIATALAFAWSAWGWGRKMTSGPYGSALLGAGLFVLLVVCILVYLPVRGYLRDRHDDKVAARAIAACEAEEEARRLRAENAAVRDAKAQSDATLRRRDTELQTANQAVLTRDQELETLRGQLEKLESARGVVFTADDPWLQRHRARAQKSGTGGR